MRRKILPDGDCIASLAGFSRFDVDLLDDAIDVFAVKPSRDVVEATDPP
jgi:hypothetical protein